MLRHLPVGFHHPAAVFRKETIQQLGGYRPQFWPADDMDLWNRVIDAGHAVLVQDEVLTQYRIHGSSVTVSKSRSTEHKSKWVQACIQARHEGRAEPTEAEFLAACRNQPWSTRVDGMRRDWARALYKSAVFSFSRRAVRPLYLRPDRRGVARAGLRDQTRAAAAAARLKQSRRRHQPISLSEARLSETLTILMPAHNAGRFLRAAIDSVLAQTHADFVVHLIDDGSTDNTAEIARAAAQQDARIRVHTQPNLGVAQTMNAALDRLQHENPDWVFCMHGDDLMMPRRLERQWAFIKRNPHLAVTSTLVEMIDDTGRALGRQRCAFTTRQAVTRAVMAGDSVAFNHPAAAFRPAVVRAVGGYRQDFWPAEDTELWNRLLWAGHSVLVQDEVLLQYRVHRQSASTARANLMVRKLAWMTCCMAARRAGGVEPTWDQFVAQQQQLPWWSRWNQLRHETARTLYQSAIHHFAARQFGSLLPSLTAAAALEPGLVLSRITARFRPGPSSL